MNQKEVTFTDILSCIKEQKEEIHEAKRETNEKIGEFMKAIENNVNDVKKDVIILNGIMEERERENKEILNNLNGKFIEMERNRREDREDLNLRMQRLGEALKSSSVTRPKQKVLQQMVRKEQGNVQPQPSGNKVPSNQPWKAAERKMGVTIKEIY